MRTADALRTILERCTPDDRLVATTGHLSRHLHELAGDSDRCFYMIGSMGLALPVAAGIVAARPATRVIVIDGDGSLLMGMAGLVMAADLAPARVHHIVIQNGCYASTGGQALPGRRTDFVALARAAGYLAAAEVQSADALAAAYDTLWAHAGPSMLVVRVDVATHVPPRVSAQPESTQRRFRTRFLRDQALA